METLPDLESFREQLAQALGMEPTDFPYDADLNTELGFDSLLAFEVTVVIDETYGIFLFDDPNFELEGCSIRDLYLAVVKTMDASGQRHP